MRIRSCLGCLLAYSLPTETLGWWLSNLHLQFSLNHQTFLSNSPLDASTWWAHKYLRNPASLRQPMTSLLPKYLSSPVVSNQGMILPPSCLSRVPKASSSSPPSPLSSTYYQISSFYLQNIFPNHLWQHLKTVREKNYFSSLDVSCHVQGNPNGHFLDANGHSWNSLPPCSLSPRRMKWLLR